MTQSITELTYVVQFRLSWMQIMVSDNLPVPG